jgi:hypothetical protein
MSPSLSDSGKLVFTTAAPNYEIFAMRLQSEQGLSTGPARNNRAKFRE